MDPSKEIHDPADLEGVAAALWAVLIPAHWGAIDLQPVKMSIELVLGNTPGAASAWLALVDQLKAQGAQGLLAPTAALHRSDEVSPCMRLMGGEERRDELLVAANVILLWCNSEHLSGWCCVPEGRPGAELLPLVRREGMLAP